VIDVEIARKVTGWTLPGLACPCCGTVTFAAPPPGGHAGSVSYGPVLNAAAVLLTAYGNVPPERAALVMSMLPGVPVSAGWVDKAAARVSARLRDAGFDDAMTAALAAERVLAADQTPVNVLDRTARPATPVSRGMCHGRHIPCPGQQSDQRMTGSAAYRPPAARSGNHGGTEPLRRCRRLRPGPFALFPASSALG
jgi:hypothetical protein